MAQKPTQITPPRVPFLDSRGFIDRRWYLWLVSLFTTTQDLEEGDINPSVDATTVYAALIDALESATIGSPYPVTDLSPLSAAVHGLEIVPQPVCCEGADDLSPAGLSYVIPTSEGGTGNSKAPDDGEFLIGNGLGFTLSTLTAGANITITNGPGSVEIAGTGGTVTSIDVSGGTTGLTFSGGPVTASGTITMAGTLGIANGGTGATDAATALANLNGADLGGATFTGTVEAPFFAVDADYFLGIVSGDPYVIFDTNDYLVYDRSANIFYISAGAPVCGFDSFGNILMGTMTPTTSATHTIHFQNATAPSTDPTGGGALYVESGALKYRGSGGTITTLAAA